MYITWKYYLLEKQDLILASTVAVVTPQYIIRNNKEGFCEHQIYPKNFKTATSSFLRRFLVLAVDVLRHQNNFQSILKTSSKSHDEIPTLNCKRLKRSKNLTWRGVALSLPTANVRLKRLLSSALTDSFPITPNSSGNARGRVGEKPLWTDTPRYRHAQCPNGFSVNNFVLGSLANAITPAINSDNLREQRHVIGDRIRRNSRRQRM